jgi:glycosyltransferase involved in cell wall biosynthesis
MKQNDRVPISIIVPVYNVCEWIDQCLQSIVDQTFQDYEIILINDGSTDQSDVKCQQWKERDNRIRYISKKNEGLYRTWNLGVREAVGKYLCFVDSDDWLDPQYVEKLYEKAVETDADMVECDFWRVNNNNGKKTYRPCYGRMEKEYTIREHMIYGESTLWKFMSKKSIWIDNNIIVPNCMGASHAVYVLLLLLGAKIVNVHEPLYFYRRLRKGSILDIQGKGAGEQGRMGLQELDALIEETKKRGLFEPNKEIIEMTVKYRLSDLLAAQFTRKTEKDFAIQFNNYYNFVGDRFPHGRNDRYFILGGYNLNRILSYLPEVQNPYYRFNFSSIISIMHPAEDMVAFGHENEYRKNMIERDIYSSFWSVIKEEKPKFLFLDFLEERFDLIKLKKGGMITKSDAFEGTITQDLDGVVMERDSEECQVQWEKDCLAFLERIVQFMPAENIILVENYLSETQGDVYSQRPYDDLETIRKTNNLLKTYYKYFKDNCSKIKRIEAYKSSFYYTDEKYEYGAVPSHLNEVVNKEIASAIADIL